MMKLNSGWKFKIQINNFIMKNEVKKALIEMFKNGEIEVLVNIYPKSDDNKIRSYNSWDATHVEVRIDGETVYEEDGNVELLDKN